MKRIAIFANGWSSEYIEMFINGISEAAKKDGVDVFVFMTYIYFGDSTEQCKRQLNIFHLPNPEDFDGAIVLANTFNIPDELDRVIALFGRAGVPMVSTEVHAPGMAYIGTDNYSGMYDLAKHIIEKHGAKKIVYMAGIEGNAECAIRKRALVDVLNENGLELYDSLRGDYGFYSALSSTLEWLKTHTAPDAFVCANDHMALGVESALHKAGYKVPDDVMVTGYDHSREAKASFPLLATVSREWSELGTSAYEELANQITYRDPSVSKQFSTKFLPSESCGCEPSPEAANDRLERVSNAYLNSTRSDMIDSFCHEVMVRTAKVKTPQEFYSVANEILSHTQLLDPTVYICLEPEFFTLEDDIYPERIRGYSKTLDVVFEKVDGVAREPHSFAKKTLIPDYEQKPGESNVFYFVPLCNVDYIIGYVAIKGPTDMISDLRLRKWIINLDSLLVTTRQRIFIEKANNTLKQIYMTDFLSGMYNRYGCNEIIYSYIEDEKKAGHDTALLFADIDYMKRINDKYGHLAGDMAIRMTAEAMIKSLPNGWMLGRYGGDEFIAVGPCPNEEFIDEQRQFLREAIRQYISENNTQFDISVSVGKCVIHPTDTGTIYEYINIADKSMYDEKEKAHRRIDE